MSLQAVAQGLRYPYSQFLLLGWFEPDWWLGSEEEQARLEGLYKDCSREARFNLIKYSLAPLSGYHTTDAAEQTDTGTVSSIDIRLTGLILKFCIWAISMDDSMRKSFQHVSGILKWLAFISSLRTGFCFYFLCS